MGPRVASSKVPAWEMSKSELCDDRTVVFDYDELLEFAEGDISKVFGPEFKVVDGYRRRVRLPAREYLLVTRVTLMDAEVGNFRVGARMVTEYDVPVNGELSEGGDVPWAVLVEAGQCDLLLISYMGIDFQCKGERVYRLLNTTLTFFGVAKEGETLVYDIRVTGFAKRPDGDISMFFFEYDCYCNGKLLIEMRDGSAGFFTDEELAAGKGVVITRAQQNMRNKIVRQSIEPFALAACTHKMTLNESDMQCLVERKWANVFGTRNKMAELNYKICARKMLMIDRVTHIDHHGGAYGLGLLIGEKNLDRNHWYFPCHFVNDQVMAGSLVSDGCSQLLKLYMIWLGLHLKMEEFDFLPVSGHKNKVRCRGQISPHKGKLVYVMEIKEMGYDQDSGSPYAIADVDIIDVNEELGQSFDINDLASYGKGDLSKKIVVDFKGIALQLKGRAFSRMSSSSSLNEGWQCVPKPSQKVEHEQPPAHCLVSDPEAPSTVSWHPMSKLPGRPTPFFSPSSYPPRAICFTPFPGNPLDNNCKAGEMPLNWYNMSEFMCGKVSNCLGPEFARFDKSNTSRSPAFDLALVTRVVEVTNMEHGKFLNVDCNPSKGTMVGEFDCPQDAWFFHGSCNDGHIPYSIIMEIGLQTSGVLTSVLKAPLTMDKDDILFRNLDASAEMVRPDVDVRGKTIRNVTKCTGYAMLGKMGIHRFTFELSVDGVVFYKGSTSFGWFTPEVFAQQAGLDNGKKTEPWCKTNNASVRRIEIASAKGKEQLTEKLSDATNAQVLRRSEQCEYLDYLNIASDSGLHGKGYVHGHKDVNPQDWFFSCHFWFDPVMPGSLGIESMFQLIEAFAVDQNIPGEYNISNPTFAHAPGKTAWKYRGQLTPKNRTMDCEVHIVSIAASPEDGGYVDIVADGALWVDGLRVYEAKELRVRVVSANTQEIPDVQQQPSTKAGSGKTGVALSPTQLRDVLLEVNNPLYLGVENSNLVQFQSKPATSSGVVSIKPCSISDLGDKSFMETYNVSAPLYTGAMAKGIASADLVIAAGKRKILGSFGAGGLPISIVREALEKIQQHLPHGPYAVNLIHSPFDSNLEKGNVDLFLEMGVTVVECSAFMELTAQVVRYRASGLSKSADGSIRIAHRIIGKVSRTELAEMFIRPAPKHLLQNLVASGELTAEQAELATQVPVADDIAVEADSGGHTDNRPIHVILPLIINLRNRLHKELDYPSHLRVRVGAGGGIGCPQAALAAFQMGAAFLITGTVNQLACESGTCDNVRLQLSKATYSDVCMAPAADMFDQGVELQVLKKGTMFPSRAKKLYELFCKYDSFEAMPAEELQRVEKRIFQKPLAEVWQETSDFYIHRIKNPEKINRAASDGKLKMSLCFRWYLGLSSFWANSGAQDRVMDYQIWCGPAIGAFNNFIKGTYLDVAVAKSYPCVAQINLQILQGAAYLKRLGVIRFDRMLLQAVDVDDPVFTYVPTQPL